MRGQRLALGRDRESGGTASIFMRRGGLGVTASGQERGGNGLLHGVRRGHGLKKTLTGRVGCQRERDREGKEGHGSGREIGRVQSWADCSGGAETGRGRGGGVRCWAYREKACSAGRTRPAPGPSGQKQVEEKKSFSIF